MRFLISLILVTVGVFALGIVLKANLAHVALGLIVGGGVGGGLLALVRRLQAMQSAPGTDQPEG